MPQVVFEPIGEEIECGEEESILDAAFRQGYNLVYGCREGQCSACKCYLLEGDVVLKPYSTFALSETEEANGYTLMCRAMPEEDLVVELLHFDPDNYRLENPIREGSATVIASEALTHDIRRLDLKVDEPIDFSFVPGQYIDVTVPGSEATAFVLDGKPARRHIELIVKRYPGGRFSSLLDGEIAEGEHASISPAPTARSTCAPPSARCCWSRAAPAWRRSCRCCAGWRPSGAPGRSASSTAPAPSATCSTLDEVAELGAAARRLRLRAGALRVRRPTAPSRPGPRGGLRLPRARRAR